MEEVPFAEQVLELGAMAVRALVARWMRSGAMPIAGPVDERMAEDHAAHAASLADAIARIQTRIAGGPSPLAAFRFLAPDELILLLLAAAPDLDGELGRAYGRLRARPGVVPADVALLLDLAAATREARLRGRLLFADDAPLFALRLLELDGDGPLLGRSVRAADAVVRAIAGSAPPTVTPRPMEKLVLPAGLVDEALVAFDALAADREAAPPTLLLRGAPGAGRRTFAVALAAARAKRVVTRELPSPKSPEDDAFSDAFRAAIRDARLADALLLVAIDEPPARISPSLERALAAAPRPLLVATGPRAPQPTWAGTCRSVAVADPTAEMRCMLWFDALGARQDLDPDEIELVAQRYYLRPAQIARAARGLAGTKDPPHLAAMLRAARGELSHALGEIAERVETRAGWDDVVLPDDVLRRLWQITARVRYADLVYDEWGFGVQSGVARGVAALFAGPPGTGKTMCAGIIANELGLELYRIDLSQVVSKWVGETEKNLSRVFDEARASRAVILFDEADSLFGKRTDVKSSSDRYANMEVNFLLQRIETYEGIAILTTNFQQSVDEAFRRRLQFRIEFPSPDAASRVALWKRLVGKNAKLAPDIDLRLLGERFAFSGGNIRNATLSAAFAAAEANTPITQKILVDAAQMEMEELGKLVSR
jgi:MoxR-like ATPase